MLEIHASRAARLRRESDFDLARFREVGLVLPLAVDLPRHHQAVRRIPDENGAPVAIGAVHLFAVAAAACSPFDDRFLHRRFADVVSARPPAVVSLREDFERALDRCLHLVSFTTPYFDCDSRLSRIGPASLTRPYPLHSL